MMFVHQYDAHEVDAPLIAAGGGAIFLRDESGQDVDLTPYEGRMPRGVFAPVNSEYGIERDDELKLFESDFAAAEAVAHHLHNLTGQTYTIWYETEGD